MEMETRQETGRRGEDIAADFLCRKGYEILCRNFRHKIGEIDIIARKANRPETIVVCEVKARKTLAYGCPGEAVNREKRERIKRAASLYAAVNNLLAQDFRADVIEILFLKEKIYIRHIENAF